MPVLTVCDSPYGQRQLPTMFELLRRLDVRPSRDGQGELKSCASPGGTGGPQVPAMRLNDRPTDRQGHTSPVILDSKECFENLVRLTWGQSHTGIVDRDQHL